MNSLNIKTPLWLSNQRAPGRARRWAIGLLLLGGTAALLLAIATRKEGL